MSEGTLYDANGSAVAFFDREDIYLYNGEPVAYFDGESVYAYDGRHLGWYVDGWVRDNSGDAVFFTDDATGGPMRPMRSIRPIRGIRGMRPMRGMRQMRPMRPSFSGGWSRLVGESFFRQR
jgi:hypothetical protein